MGEAEEDDEKMLKASLLSLLEREGLAGVPSV